MSYLGWAACALLIFLAACSSNSKDQDGPLSDAAASARLQAIPSADPAQYAKLPIKNWRNPYMIVHRDNFGLLDLADSEEIILKSGEVLSALAKLPASSWPYGRVVAVEESSAHNTADAVAVRRNRGILAGTLEQAHIVIDWVPSN